jgi:hypothetical protein
VYRPGARQAAAPPEHPNIVAVATDAPVATRAAGARSQRPDAIAEFILITWT